LRSSGQKKLYKYWWSEKLSILKQNAIDTNKVWKAAGKPRYGPIFDKLLAVLQTYLPQAASRGAKLGNLLVWLYTVLS